MNGRTNLKRIKKTAEYIIKFTLILLVLKIIGIIHCSFLTISLPILIPVSLIFMLILIFILAWSFVIILNEIQYKRKNK